MYFEFQIETIVNPFKSGMRTIKNMPDTLVGGKIDFENFFNSFDLFLIKKRCYLFLIIFFLLKAWHEYFWVEVPSKRQLS